MISFHVRFFGSRPKVVILGAGWGGFTVAKGLKPGNFDVVVVSPRNHFLFTPLLPSTAVGTLEYRCIQEPVRTLKGVTYHQADCTSIELDKKLITCQDVYTKLTY